MVRQESRGNRSVGGGGHKTEPRALHGHANFKMPIIPSNKDVIWW